MSEYNLSAIADPKSPCVYQEHVSAGVGRLDELRGASAADLPSALGTSNVLDGPKSGKYAMCVDQHA